MRQMYKKVKLEKIKHETFDDKQVEILKHEFRGSMKMKKFGF